MSCVSRVDSLSAIITNYSEICESLIRNEGKSSGNAKSKARGHRKCQEDPKFIIAIAVPQYVLSFLKPLTCFLQKTNYDMVVAFDQA